MTAAKRRGRPPKAAPIVRESAHQEAALAAPPPEEVFAAPDTRPAMRAEMREEDSRTRAARRAQEIRDHGGNDQEEGTDEFFVHPSMVPPGFEYQWKRDTVLGQEDPAYNVQTALAGWEPVPADRHPEFMPRGSKSKTIDRKGMRLYEIPKVVANDMRDRELRKARNQVRVKEAQLNSAPQDQFERDADPRTLASVKKSYSPMPIPE